MRPPINAYGICVAAEPRTRDGRPSLRDLQCSSRARRPDRCGGGVLVLDAHDPAPVAHDGCGAAAVARGALDARSSPRGRGGLVDRSPPCCTADRLGSFPTRSSPGRRSSGAVGGAPHRSVRGGACAVTACTRWSMDFLLAALVFWAPIVRADPSPSVLSYPGKILYLFVAMPAMALLGLAIVSARQVLYPTYAQAEGVARALADQRSAGAIMWAGTMVLIVPALGIVLVGVDGSRRARGPKDRCASSHAVWRSNRSREVRDEREGSMPSLRRTGRGRRGDLLALQSRRTAGPEPDPVPRARCSSS